MIRRTKKHILIIFFVLCAFNIMAESGFAKLFSSVVRRAGGILDDVPLNKLDDVPLRKLDDVPLNKLDDVPTLDSASVGKSIREEMELKQGGPLDDATYAKKLPKLLIDELKMSSGTLDAQTLKVIKEASTFELEVATLLSRGASRIKDVVPDIAHRGALLGKMDADSLFAVGRYDGLNYEALRFDKALELKKFPSPPGVRDLTFNDFGAFFKKTGDAGYVFWKNSIKPHWKLWLGTTAFAALLLAPEDYLDEVGNLTEEGARKITSFGGELVVSALRGAAEGTVDVIASAVDAACEVVEESVEVADDLEERVDSTYDAVEQVVEKKVDSAIDAFFTSKIGITLSAFVVLGLLFLFRKPIIFLCRLLKILVRPLKILVEKRPDDKKDA